MMSTFLAKRQSNPSVGRNVHIKLAYITALDKVLVPSDETNPSPFPQTIINIVLQNIYGNDSY